MTLFAEKEVFNLLGLEAIEPSPLHTSQDCAICTKPLAIQPILAPEKTSQSQLHPAVRISACSHIVGKECLDAWLDTSYMCPICNRQLFDAKSDAITQQDFDRIVRSLSRYYGIYSVKASISRVTRRMGAKYILQKPIRGGGGFDEQIEDDDDDDSDGSGYSGGEFWSIEEEMELDEELEDDGYMELDEQDESEDEEFEDCDDAEGKEGKEKDVTGSEE